LFAWQSHLVSIAQGITAPVFQGGRLKANLRASRAQYDQTVAAYSNAVLIAYGEYWFQWYMRRLAERPANVWFVVKNVLR